MRTNGLVAALAAILMLPSAGFAAGKQLVFGYVTPGPDTWYK